MNREDFRYWLRGIVIAALVICLVVGVVTGLFRIINISVESGCERLGDRIGYNTKRVSGACYIEVRPNLWIAEYEIANILPLIDCERLKGE